MNPKEMDIKEFREKGYLQEMNRKFLHPLGLALEVIIDEESGVETLGRIWDGREDPVGFFFGDVEADKIKFVSSELIKREPARVVAIGQTFQPPGKLRDRRNETKEAE